MPAIPSTINGVAVDFAPAVKNNVVQRVVDALRHCVKPDVAPGHPLARIFVSSARRQSSTPSRHPTGQAVDISRINGKLMSVHYPSDAQIKAIVNALQEIFETYEHRRENFGPHFKKKLGQPHQVAGHRDHIHYSVN